METHRSPFDPYLYAFLVYLQKHTAVFSPTSAKSAARVAESIDVQPALVEALFTSAASRGLVRPVPAPRGRIRWSVSRKGEEFLSAYAPAGDDGG